MTRVAFATTRPGGGGTSLDLRDAAAWGRAGR